ncbi:MAG: diguanylate cyclase, partial [Gammaproteobacteria bacterium]|nr:diguanylate cyclase [Gammaproteobacteria bacterium]
EGQDSQLDAILKGLRETVRASEPDRAALQRLQSRLEVQVREFDDRRSARLQRLTQSLIDMIGQLLALEPLAEPERELKTLERTLRRDVPIPSDLPDLLDSLARLQARVLDGHQRASGKPEAGKPSLLKRLFGQTDVSPASPAPVAETIPSVVPVPVPAPAAAESTAESPVDTTEIDPGEEDGSLLVQLARQVSQVVGQLLEQISLPTDWEARAKELRERLAESSEWDELRLALDEIANLVIAAVGRGQREFETFLQTLDERLAKIQEQVAEDILDTDSWRSTSRALGETVQGELLALHEEVRQAKDLPSLKGSVQTHVERIGVSLTRFRELDSEREEQLTEQLSTLRQKLVALEAQSEAMHRQLREERARALTDVLTRLPNREAWVERVDQEFRRWQRYGQSVSLAVVDIDFFKRINDTYGHLAGDRVIQLIGRTLRQRLRETDFVARYGGEEFVVLLPETTLVQAWQVVDKLRQHVAELPFHFRQERVRITFSAGVALFTTGASPESVFDAADRALYAAKSQGRNRVVAHEAPPDAR